MDSLLFFFLSPSPRVSMDVLANHSIFQELQLVHDTGYFSAMPSLEENWQQVRGSQLCIVHFLSVHAALQRHMRPGCNFPPGSLDGWMRVCVCVRPSVSLSPLSLYPLSSRFLF